MKTETPAKHPRPLSPHLQVYKLPMTAVMSILHRITGAALAVGSLLVIAVLMAAATGEDSYNMVMNCMTSPLGIILLFGWSLALFYHSFNGIRHLLWDMGFLFKLENARLAGHVVLAATALCTCLVWFLAYN